MKNLYFATTLLALGLTATAASPRSLNVFRPEMSNIEGNVSRMFPVNIPTYAQPQGTRSVEEPQTVFVSDKASYYMYSDGMCYLFLSNCDVDKGNPAGPGQYMRVLINSDPTETPATTALPTGVFEAAEGFDPGTFNMENTVCMDVFENPGNPGSGELVGYQYIASDGMVEISEDNGVYTIKASFNGVNDVEGYEDDVRLCETEYTGEVPYVDIHAYTPLEGDTVLELYGASGRYVEGGNFSICFYSEGLIDEDGWIVNAGQLMNIELFVEPVEPMDPKSLVGTFSPFNMMEGTVVPDSYAQGIWYDYYGMYMSIGTYLSIYDANANVTNTGLAEDGTITISRNGDDYTVELDLVTFEGHKIVGSWTGDLLAAVEDWTSGVETISNDINISGGFGCVNAPAGAEVYSISGSKVGSDNLPAGIYVVKANGMTRKVAVK